MSVGNGCDHNFVVLTPEDSEEPLGLQCTTCERMWPVGPALPEVYDWVAEGVVFSPYADLDEDEEAEHTTDEHEANEKEQGETT